MSDTTKHGLPDDVLLQAASYMIEVATLRLSTEQQLVAALPILRPAIERQLLQRMIADLDLVAGVFGGSQNAEAYRTLLRTYLPTTTESEAGHE